MIRRLRSSGSFKSFSEKCGLKAMPFVLQFIYAKSVYYS